MSTLPQHRLDRCRLSHKSDPLSVLSGNTWKVILQDNLPTKRTGIPCLRSMLAFVLSSGCMHALGMSMATGGCCPASRQVPLPLSPLPLSCSQNHTLNSSSFMSHDWPHQRLMPIHSNTVLDSTTHSSTHTAVQPVEAARHSTAHRSTTWQILRMDGS